MIVSWPTPGLMKNTLERPIVFGVALTMEKVLVTCETLMVFLLSEPSMYRYCRYPFRDFLAILFSVVTRTDVMPTSLELRP
jgi:hypothetical protein